MIAGPFHQVLQKIADSEPALAPTTTGRPSQELPNHHSTIVRPVLTPRHATGNPWLVSGNKVFSTASIYPTSRRILHRARGQLSLAGRYWFLLVGLPLQLQLWHMRSTAGLPLLCEPFRFVVCPLSLISHADGSLRRRKASKR